MTTPRSPRGWCGCLDVVTNVVTWRCGRVCCGSSDGITWVAPVAVTPTVGRRPGWGRTGSAASAGQACDDAWWRVTWTVRGCRGAALGALLGHRLVVACSGSGL